jgi:DNA polymerase III subunit beta
MKLTLTRQSLSDALSVVAPAVARRGSLPILAGVKLESTPGRLTVEASNLDQTITTTVQANVEDPGCIVAPAALLSSLVGSLIGSDVAISVEKKDRLTVRSGRNETKLAGFASDEWPQPAALDGALAFTLPGPTLAAGIAATEYAVARDESRPALTGVLVECLGDQVTLVAADSFRLAIWTTKADAPTIRAIVPGAILKSVAKLARAGDVAISLDTRRATFTAGETTIATRLIEAQFPKYQAIIPKSADITVIVSAAELDRAARAVLTVGRSSANIVKLTIESDRLVLSSTSEDGTSEEEVAATLTGTPGLTIGVNGQYLSEALGTFAGQVTLGLTTAGRPFTIRAVDGDAQLAVVMPMAIGRRGNG